MTAEGELQAYILCGRTGYVDVDGALSVDCAGGCLGHLYGWRGMHVGPLKTSHGWRTPTRGDMGAGWPDLLLVRDGVVMAIEVKSRTGKVSDEQLAVLSLLASAGVKTYVFRPEHLDDGSIVAALDGDR